MKRAVAVLIILLISLAIFRLAYISEEKERELQGQLTEEAVKQEGQMRRETLRNADIDCLAEEFCFPEPIYEGLGHGTDMGAFPEDIVHELGEALFGGGVQEALASINNEEWMITVKDFSFHPNTGDDVPYEEELLNEAMSEGASGFVFYRCDLSGEGTDEIIALEGPGADKEGYVFLLKNRDEGYEYADFDYIGSHSGAAVFDYDGFPYMAVSFEGDPASAEAVGLFCLSGEGEHGWRIDEERLYLQRKYTSCNIHALYEIPDNLLAEKVRGYAEEICEDLIFADRTDSCFVGDETKSEEMEADVRENNEEMEFQDIFAADMDNDGQQEYFGRKIHQYDRPESRIIWYDPETRTVCAPPLDIWTPAGFHTSQMWVRVIEGKTVSFFLYKKEQEDIYLLDARVCEEGRTTPLSDWMIDLQWRVDASDQRDYGDADFFEECTVYSDPDYHRAFPDDLAQIGERAAAQAQEPFQAVWFEHENVPAELIVGLERALFKKNPDLEGLCDMAPEADPDVFFALTGKEDGETFDRYPNHIYEFSIDGGDYYLTVTDSGGTARFAEICMYRKENGALTEVFASSTLDMNAKVLMYGGENYLVELYYNYYSKSRDTYLVGKLTPDGIMDCVRIAYLPEGFKGFIWEKLYDAQTSGSEAVSDYVDSVKEELMAATPITDDIRIFTGDESPDIGHEESLRLRSVAGEADYYRIDMDNDGEDEYLKRHYWFPSNATQMYLIENEFQISEGRTKRMHLEFGGREEPLLQLWFKEIEGKVYTFRLFLMNGYHYLLNVSLIEGNEIAQIQSYIIVPEMNFKIGSEEYRTGGWG